MRNIFALLGGVMALLVLLVPAAAQDQTVVDIAVGDDNFSTLVAAVEAADLVEVLSGDGPFTVLAPTNAAFDAALESLGLTAEEALANTELLTNILTYHVASGTLTADDLQGSTTMLSGEDISVEGTVVNGSANITTLDLIASNGIVHVLDAVLIPPSLSPASVRVAHLSPDAPAVDVYLNGEVALSGLEYPSITDFVELLPGTYEVAVAPAGTSIDEAAIGPVEVAITSGSFSTIAAVGTLADGTLTAQVLDESFYGSSPAEGSAAVNFFHAIDAAGAVNVLADRAAVVTQLAYPGSRVTNDGAFNIEVPEGTYRFDVETGGVPIITQEGVPIVAGVYYFAAAIGTPDEPSLFIVAEGLTPTVVDVLAEDTSTSTLVTAVEAAGLVETLSGIGPFTVLAPTNAAFAEALDALGLSPAEALANPDLLSDILIYHVIPGDFSVEDLEAAGSVTTVQGASVEFSEGSLNGSATIEVADLDAANGTVHIIDAVLLPPE